MKELMLFIFRDKLSLKHVVEQFNGIILRQALLL